MFMDVINAEDFLRYTTRKKILRIVIIVVSIVLFIGLNVLIFMTIAKPKTPLGKRLVELNISEFSHIYPYEDGILCVDGYLLSCYDSNGVFLYSADLPEVDMKASRSGDRTIVWSDTIAQVFNESGINLLQKQLFDMGDDSKILMGRCGSQYFVLATIEEGQYRARIYDLEANDVDTILFSELSLLDLGFYGETGNQLWSLLLDYHGTVPISKMRTDQPGKSITGSIRVIDQICYDVVPLDRTVYTIGTHHIQSYTYTNKKLSEQLIYGWTMQDYITTKDAVSFLMGPAETSQVMTPLSSLWYLGDDASQYQMSMPSGIMGAMLTQDNIYAISVQGVYEFKIGSDKQKFYKMPFKIDELTTIIKSKAFVLKSDDKFYLIPVE